jgi:lipopolysaccharide export system permease protein
VKKIDRYLGRMYLVNYAGALGLFVLIAIVFDLTEKLDGFLKHSLGVYQVWNEYYVHFTPYYANLLSPLFVFIAVIFTGARLAQRNEIITLLNAGWSFGRISRPFLGAALLIGGLNYVLSNFVLPPSNRARIRFESQYLRDPGYSHTRHRHLQTAPGRLVYLESYSHGDSTGYRLAMDRFVGGQLISRLSAERLVWKASCQCWMLTQVTQKSWKNNQTKVSQFDTLFRKTGFKPEDFGTSLAADAFLLDRHELLATIRELERKGSEPTEAFWVEHYSRLAIPFSALIFTMMGLSLSTQKKRGGMGPALGWGLGLCFAFIVMQRFSLTFAVKGNLSPLLAAWTPNLLFGLATAYLYRKAPR